MRLVGYSTGAIALGDFSHALAVLAAHSLNAVELSALRMSEVEPLLRALPEIDLRAYVYVSFHAPSSFQREEEQHLVSLLSGLPASWPIVLHPDTIHQPRHWASIESRLAIENMDRRKNTGRSAAELKQFFGLFPQARMCLDLGHTRQVDPSMIGAYELLQEFSPRIVQLHISEVDTLNRHDRISHTAALAFLQVQQFVPADAALILESRVSEAEIDREVEKVNLLFSAQPLEKKARGFLELCQPPMELVGR
jgi:hypothetical protein